MLEITIMIVNCGNSPSGDKVKKINIKKGILEATILTYGATLQKLKIRNFDQSLVLGYQNHKDYFFDNASKYGFINKNTFYNK